jgi:hypothetical protein
MRMGAGMLRRSCAFWLNGPKPPRKLTEAKLVERSLAPMPERSDSPRAGSRCPLPGCATTADGPRSRSWPRLPPAA